MSDDRFKQARQNLINQGQQASFNDYDDSEEATAMVDISQFQNQPAANPVQFQPPPTFADYGEEEDGATQMVDLNSLQAGPDIATSAQNFGGTPAPNFGGTPAPIQVGQETDYEASTQFVNINDLADGGAPQAQAPQSDMVDYSDGGGIIGGSTQFVDINALAQGQFDGPSLQQVSPIEQDQTLLQGYSFSPEAIQKFGDITLIFATSNQSGLEVVLKRVWEGSPDQLPDWLITRIRQLEQIKHKNIAAMNGLFTSASGCWVELGRPKGNRLSVLLQQGPKDPGLVAKWMRQVAEGLKAIHAFSILYANLTPDAIWVDEETKSVMLEPFDVMTFENRGTLGVYGAPELQLPPEQRPVTPATDVYSFAAVTLACLTGQVSPQALESLQKQDKLKDALRESLNPDPNARPTVVEPIIAALGGGLDKRVLIPIVAVAVIFMALTIAMGDEEEKQAAKIKAPVTAPKIDPMAIKPQTIKDSEIEKDDRLKIETSYKLNPGNVVESKKAKVPTQSDLEMAEKKRILAKQYFKDAGISQKSDKERYYKKALTSLTKAIQAQGKMTSEDKAMFKEFMDNKYARGIYGSYLTQLESRLKNDGIATAKITYDRLAELDPNAKERMFFVHHNKAKVVVIKGKGLEKKDDPK